MIKSRFAIIFIVTERLVGLVVSMFTTDHEVVGSLPGISTNFKMWIKSGTGSTQPREDNWVAT